ncbi:MAG: hypothetical protein R3315_04380 [Woeseiaceae bacterium]|nr:hypothetical protein [Woeseiaceae bacterium]
MRTVLAALILVLATPALALAQSNGRNTYKWESDDGVPSYGDTVPPEAADQEKKVLNDAGITVDVLAGKKTPEEIAEEERLAAIAAERERQRRADQALLATYLTVEEIEMHRDRRVELFQAQARVTELYLKNLNRRLASLEKEAQNFRPYSEDPDAEMIDQGLLDDLNETRATIDRHEQNLRRYKLDETQMNARFQDDIDRFRRLKGLDDSAIASSQPVPE